MLHHHPLDLGRVGVEAADDEHVLLAVGDVDVAVGVHHGDVAGVEPSLGIDRLGRLLRLVEVAGGHDVAPHQELALGAPGHLGPGVVDHPQLDVGDGAARGGGDDLGRVVGPGVGGDARGLGHPVGGDDALEAEPVPHGDHQLGGDGGGAGETGPQRRDVVAVEVGVVEHPLEQRRRPGEDGDPLPLDDGQHLGGVVDGDRGVAGPGHEAHDDPGVEPKGVEVRVDQQVRIAGADAERLAPGVEGPDDGPAPHQHALGMAGGAGGEHDGPDVGGGHGGGAPLHLGLQLVPVGPVAPGHQGVEPGDQVHHVGQVGEILAGQGAGVVGVEEPVDDEQGLHPGLGQHVGRLAALEPGVDRHQHGPGPGRPQGGRHPLPAVGGPHGHGVARLDPRGDQGPGHAVDPAAQLGVAQRRPAPGVVAGVDDGRPVAPGGDGPGHEAGQGGVAVVEGRDVGRGGVGGVCHAGNVQRPCVM